MANNTPFYTDSQEKIDQGLQLIYFKFIKIHQYMSIGVIAFMRFCFLLCRNSCVEKSSIHCQKGFNELSFSVFNSKFHSELKHRTFCCIPVVITCQGRIIESTT